MTADASGYLIGEAVLLAAFEESYRMPNEDEDDYLRLNGIDPAAARAAAAAMVEAARATPYDYDEAVIETFLQALDMGVRIGKALPSRRFPATPP